MDRRNCYTWLTIASILCLFSLQFAINAEASSVVFIDSPTHQYLRAQSEPDALSETNSMSLLEVGAAVSVLLGFTPPSTLTAAGSSKINDVLLPNPFDRPRAVFALEVTGEEDSQLLGDASFGGSIKRRVVGEENRADIHVPDEDEVSSISLDDIPLSDSAALSSDKDLSEIASFLGGSYASGHLPLSGELTIPLADGDNLKLDMAKKEEMELISGIVGLLHKIDRAMVMLEDLSTNGQSELITGTFNGIKALEARDGSEVKKGAKLFAASVAKLFDYLQTRYKGQIVGVIIHGEAVTLESKKLLNMVVTSRPSSRWLQEAEAPNNIPSIVVALLVRKTIAWTTGILLLVASLLGVYFLMYMPITKDTLLYSNVKLD